MAAQQILQQMLKTLTTDPTYRVEVVSSEDGTISAVADLGRVRVNIEIDDIPQEQR